MSAHCDPGTVTKRFSAIVKNCSRVLVGVLAGFYLGPAAMNLDVTLRWNDDVALAVGIAGGILLSWLSFSQFLVLRIGAWMCAGLGAGLILECIVWGGLPVGTHLTTSGLVLGLVGIYFAFRARRFAKTKDHVSSK